LFKKKKNGGKRFWTFWGKEAQFQRLIGLKGEKCGGGKKKKKKNNRWKRDRLPISKGVCHHRKKTKKRKINNKRKEVCKLLRKKKKPRENSKGEKCAPKGPGDKRKKNEAQSTSVARGKEGKGGRGEETNRRKDRGMAR